MFVSLNARRQHSFDEPLGLMTDCHRRVEQFLGILNRIVDQAVDRALTATEREAVLSAMKYFQVAAPKHTADEEESLFPRLRESNDGRAAEALSKVQTLQADHLAANRLHEECDELLRHWLDGSLTPRQTHRLQEVVHTLQSIYRGHIAMEETEVFPLASEILPPDQLQSMGAEMAERRGLRYPAEDQK